MKRSVLGHLGLAAFVLSMGLAGCGGGIDEGPPADMKPGVPIDPKMTDMMGRSFKDQRKAEATARAAAKEAPKAQPEEKKE